jgi:hypothetical protein
MSSHTSLASPSNSRNTNIATVSNNVSPNGVVSPGGNTETVRPPETPVDPLGFGEFSAADREQIDAIMADVEERHIEQRQGHEQIPPIL